MIYWPTYFFCGATITLSIEKCYVAALITLVVAVWWATLITDGKINGR